MVNCLHRYFNEISEMSEVAKTFNDQKNNYILFCFPSTYAH